MCKLRVHFFASCNTCATLRVHFYASFTTCASRGCTFSHRVKHVQAEGALFASCNTCATLRVHFYASFETCASRGCTFSHRVKRVQIDDAFFSCSVDFVWWSVDSFSNLHLEVPTSSCFFEKRIRGRFGKDARWGHSTSNSRFEKRSSRYVCGKRNHRFCVVVCLARGNVLALRLISKSDLDLHLLQVELEAVVPFACLLYSAWAD